MALGSSMGSRQGGFGMKDSRISASNLMGSRDYRLGDPVP